MERNEKPKKHANGSFRGKNTVFEIKKFCTLKGLMAEYTLQKTKTKQNKQNNEEEVIETIQVKNREKNTEKL